MSTRTHRPILIVRWIYGTSKKDDEIAAIRKTFGRDTAIRTVRARHKEEVYESFKSWLKATPDPQVLYIGAHGNPLGLMDRPHKSPELMEWEQLGRHLASVPEAFKNRVELILGACYSSLAPAKWTELKLRVPVSRVFCIAEEPVCEDVVALILGILKNDKEQKRLAIAEKKLTYLDEDLRELLRTLPGRLDLRLFLRGDRGNKYAFVELKDPNDQLQVQEVLEGRGNRRKKSQLASAVQKELAADAPSNADLKRLREETKRPIAATDGIRSVRPLPKQGIKGKSRRENGPKRKKNV